MGYSISRLTLFAVISSIETDLRNLIATYLGQNTNLQEILGVELAQQVLDRLEKDFGRNRNLPTLSQLVVYIDFADSYQLINANSNYLPHSIIAYIRTITPKLEKLVPVRNRVMHSRPLQFDDFANVLDTSQELIKAKEFTWNSLKTCLSQLEKEPGFVLGLKIPEFVNEKRKHNLPIPDFDETGFLGRKQQVTDLLRCCLGPYPVISVIGDGGIGKSALALRVAYDLLDLPDCPFEDIVWTSSKTTQLTGYEIKRIEGAISDSLGVFTNIIGEFLTDTVENPIEEILEYLKVFKILLIIDNLETVLDEKIRSFLERLPQGSKVLITSRISLGAFEYPLKLQAMDQREAVDLLRALAKVRGVPDLVKVSNSHLTHYCTKMKNSPGFIKWFVSVVQAGKRPEEALAKPDIFLDFCMSNIYNYLSNLSKGVLRSMLCLPGRHSLAKLNFVNEIEFIDLQAAVHELLRTNMVIMSSTAKGSSYESQYEVSDLARKYLSKHHPVETKEFDRFNKRKRQLVATGEEFQAKRNTDPYLYSSLSMRSQSDLIVAKYLTDALKQAKNKKFDLAENLINTARDLAPEYFEVYRVDAIVKTYQGNYSAAQAAYEAAVELEPLSAPIHKLYGNFLMEHMDDTELALAHFRKAAELDPQSIEVQLEIARALLYLHDFAQAINLLEKLLIKPNLPTISQTKAYDIYIQCFYRQADFEISQHDYGKAIKHLAKLKETYISCPSHIKDDRMKEKIRKAVPLAKTCLQFLSSEDEQIRNHANSIMAWLEQHFDKDNNRITGNIITIGSNKKFGFIKSNNNEVFYFSFSQVISETKPTNIKINNKATFTIGSNAQGPCAINVIIE